MHRLIALMMAMVVLTGGLGAQSAESQRRSQLAALIASRLKAEQPIELAADDIMTTGDVTRLKGHVRIVADDTVIWVEEATLNHATKQVELIGDLRASIGRRSGIALPRPRVDYR